MGSPKLFIGKIIALMMVIAAGLAPLLMTVSDHGKAAAASFSIKEQKEDPPPPQEKIDRIAGKTRYETAKAVAERYNSASTQNIVIATGEGFSDALAASVLAHQLDAPILLAGDAALDYAGQHLAPEGTVWLMGGTAVVDERFADRFAKVERLSGKNQYETAVLIARRIKTSDTVVICAGQSFADALSISAIAADNGWPILPVANDFLPEPVKEYLLDVRPAHIYIVGGHGVVSYDVEDELRKICPSASLERFQGADRYATSAQILAKFAPASQDIYFASGNGFADALTGSVLAAQSGGVIVLCDSNYIDLPPDLDRYYANLPGKPKTHVLGGQLAVSDATVLQAGRLAQPPEAKKTDFVNLAEYIPALLIDLPYAGTDNFTQTKLYNQNIAYLRKGTADKLKAAVEELNRAGYHARIWDAYRPPEVQFKMWSVFPDANYVANPWAGYSSHSRGSAVDITIDNLPMPTAYDDFSARASRANQNDNARYLEAVMVKHGFKPLASEWWHFIDTETYEPAEKVTLAPQPVLRPNQKTEIKISVIGDLILGQDFRFGNFNDYYHKYGPGYFLSGVRDILAGDTLTIGNLEGALTNRTAIIGKTAQQNNAYWFKGLPAYTAILTAGSIEAVNVANNHSLDYLQAGYDDTIANLNKAGIASFGYDKTAVINNVGLIGANVLGPIEEGVDLAAFRKNLIAQIQNLKQKVPLVIVYFHWGKEYSSVEERQVELARLAIDSGADLVVGSHPHILQPMEQYNGKTIVYSLGNFVFGGNTRVRSNETAIFQQTFRFVNGELVSANDGQLIPCYVSGDDYYNDYRPVLK